MKVGTENRTKLWIMAVLLIAAGLLVARSMGVLSTRPTAPAVAKTEKKAAPVLKNLDPRLQLALLRVSEERNYEGGKRNIFQMRSEEAPAIPMPNGNGRNNTPPPPPQPAGPPPINLKFFGFANLPGQPKKVFLS